MQSNYYQLIPQMTLSGIILYTLLTLPLLLSLGILLFLICKILLYITGKVI